MTDARDRDGRLLPDEERLTRLGRFLRRSRVDELPELWNIMKGDMSLVGPRPLLPDTVDDMGSDGIRRGLVRPGLTGWAQVNGNARLSGKDKLALRSEEHTSELQSLMRISYAVFCLKKKQ